MNIYLENIEAEIKRQIRWQHLEDEIEVQLFLREVMSMCKKLYTQSERKWLKTQKLKHGAGKND